METYDDLADLFEELAKGHQRAAQFLNNYVSDAEHIDTNIALGQAEARHADACRRAAKVLRDRQRTHQEVKPEPDE